MPAPVPRRPTMIDKVLGVGQGLHHPRGGGPFPTEVKDAVGDRIREMGGEYGATNGQAAQCGWFDRLSPTFDPGERDRGDRDDQAGRLE